jgi:ABC-2 type transport system ATP-binding protein
VVTLRAADNSALLAELAEQYRLSARLENGTVTFTVPDAKEWLPRFVRESAQPLLSLSMRGPTLDDVFLKVTGAAIREQSAEPFAMMRRWRRNR